MVDELQQQNSQKKEYVVHPYIPFVIFYNGKIFCVKHLKLEGMNAGSMKQHIQGKAHQLDFVTGKSINKIDVSEMIKESQNQVPIKSERELVDDFYHIVTKIFELKDRTQAIIIANHTLEGRKRVDVLNHLITQYNDEHLFDPNRPYIID